MANLQHKVVIVGGGGTAGITVAAPSFTSGRWAKSRHRHRRTGGVSLPPAGLHLVGAGFSHADTRRPVASLVPPGVKPIRGVASKPSSPSRTRWRLANGDSRVTSIWWSAPASGWIGEGRPSPRPPGKNGVQQPLPEHVTHTRQMHGRAEGGRQGGSSPSRPCLQMPGRAAEDRPSGRRTIRAGATCWARFPALFRACPGDLRRALFRPRSWSRWRPATASRSTTSTIGGGVDGARKVATPRWSAPMQGKRIEAPFDMLNVLAAAKPAGGGEVEPARQCRGLGRGQPEFDAAREVRQRSSSFKTFLDAEFENRRRQ